MTTSPILLISVGNSRSRLAVWQPVDADARVSRAGQAQPRAKGTKPVASGELAPSRVMNNRPLPELLEAAASMVSALRPTADDSRGPTVVVASVNDATADPLIDALNSTARVVRLVAPGARGSKGPASSPTGASGLSIPIQHDLVPPITVGVDRLLAALGAHHKSGEACVVIDAGTAVTVDFIDSWGVFQGGVIAPGVGAMLKAMHETTSALPLIEVPRSTTPVAPGAAGGGAGARGGGGAGAIEPSEPTPPHAPTIAKTTRDAMLLGATRAVQGLAHRMIDDYAQLNASYPRVIATGGDAALLFESDDLVEHIVPDLVLMGMAAAWHLAHSPDAGSDPDDRAGAIAERENDPDAQGDDDDDLD
jgi:type III pantothenate kinase